MISCYNVVILSIISINSNFNYINKFLQLQLRVNDIIVLCGVQSAVKLRYELIHGIDNIMVNSSFHTSGV